MSTTFSNTQRRAVMTTHWGGNAVGMVVTVFASAEEFSRRFAKQRVVWEGCTKIGRNFQEEFDAQCERAGKVVFDEHRTPFKV